MMWRLTCLLIAFTIGCHAPAPKATPEPEPAVAKTPVIPRVVAIGDVHGDLGALKAALRLGGLLGPNGEWTGGNTTLVQTGDLLDRGDDDKEVVDLMVKLRKQAPNFGGRVIQLAGNHELMNVMGDFRYVTPKAMSAFDSSVTPEQIAKFAEAPEPIRGRLAAWRPGGVYAQKIAPDGVIAQVGDTVFVHGGVLPAHAADVKDVNSRVSSWLRGDGPRPDDLVASDSSPVWTRLYSDNPGPEACGVLRETLKTLEAKRMVVGHTVQIAGVASACDGMVVRIDVGMSAHYGGKPAAIEIVGDALRVLAN